MDDRVGSMRRFAAPSLAVAVAVAVAVALALAACGDDLSLEVQVQHPPGAEVASTTVSIYESATTTCKELELGDLSTAELQAILVTEQTIGANAGGALEGISRKGRKLVVARGFEADGRLVTAGCSQQDAITGRDVVEVDTDFAATLSVGAANPDMGLPVTLTDADGRSLSGHPMTWRVYGPDGATAGTSSSAVVPAEDGSWELAAPTCTGEGGVVRVHPVPPSTVGGYAIALRPSWPAQPNALLTSFTKVDPTLTEILPKPDVVRPCAIRVSGLVRRLVCAQLTLTGAVIAREYDVTIQSGNGRLAVRNATSLDATTVGLYSVERGAGVRDVYAITASAQVIGLFNPSVPPAPSPPLPTPGTVGEAVLVPGCDALQAPRLVVRVDNGTVDQRLYEMPPAGGPATAYHGVTTTNGNLDLSLRSAGCVTELKPGSSTGALRRQAVVADVTEVTVMGSHLTTSVVFECELLDDTRCRANLPVPGAGAGLSGPDEEPRLTGMFFDASGVVMSSWVLLPGRSEFLLVERDRVPAASIPRLVLSGQFDGDGLTDMFWNMPSLTGQATNLQVTYGRRIGTQRLSALSGQQPIGVDDLLVGDLTGDGVDDVVLLGKQRRDTTTIAAGLIVVPMDVAIPNPDPGLDPPCR
jgi:hypothetical protein